MEIIALMVFVSLTLVLGAVGLFAWLIKERAHEHADRLALLPLDEDPVQSGDGGKEPRN